MEVITLFLTIGEKVKKCRKFYGLKQNDFSKFGISQHYISMIEQEKRHPTNQMVDQIYDALNQLTQGEILALYTKKAFHQTPAEQVSSFITLRCETEPIQRHYEQSVKLAKEYQLYELVYQLHFLRGKHYQDLLCYEDSNNYFTIALHEAVQLNIDLSLAYRELAFNAKQTMNYKVALNYYLLTSQYAAEPFSEFYYQAEYNIAFMYIEVGQIEMAIKRMNQIKIECPFQEIMAGCYMLQSYAYSKLEQWQKCKFLMLYFIENNIYEPYLIQAQHNLALSFFNLGQYDEAMRCINEAIKSKGYSDKLSLSYFLKGKIHHEIGELEMANVYYEMTREFMVENSFYAYVQDWYEVNIRLHHELRDYEQVLLIFEEVKQLQMGGRVSRGFLNELKLKFKKWEFKPLSKHNQEEINYYLTIFNL